MTTITATKARSNLFQLLKKTIKWHMHTKISSKEGNAILLSEEDYENLIESIELMSIPGLKESVKKAKKEIKRGEVCSYDEVFGEK